MVWYDMSLQTVFIVAGSIPVQDFALALVQVWGVAKMRDYVALHCTYMVMSYTTKQAVYILQNAVAHLCNHFCVDKQ